MGDRLLSPVLCSAETESQVLETGKLLSDQGSTKIFRSGLWKPRTSPNSFEGVGSKGLPWLKNLKEQTGLKITVEVAKAKHVEACLEFGIDILWIGARTTVSPFAVQEIADALEGTNIPVLIKNPINPDLGLWLGAVERIKKAGITDIGVIHRGFSNLSERYYRNRPQWQIPIEFMRRNPNLPMICDPSHICGRRDIIKDVSQKALNLDFDGLMIETHTNPDQAWSDANQQITPIVLQELLNELEVRHDFQDNFRLQSKLEQMREVIDNLDDEIINLLANRMSIARDIGKYKHENNITIYQDKRWNEVVERCLKRGSSVDLSREFIIDYIRAVHDESINQQDQVMRKLDVDKKPL